jgi:hypothetical protein
MDETARRHRASDGVSGNCEFEVARHDQTTIAQKKNKSTCT